MRLMANLQWIELIIMFICEITYPHENMGHLFLLLLIYFNYFSSHNLFNYIIDLMIYSYDKIINMKIIHSYENARIFNSNRHRHGLRTPNEDFCHWNPKLFGLTIRVDNFWDIWGIFGRFISTHFCTVTPLSMFFIINHYFNKKLSRYIQIPNKELGF